MVEGGRNKNEKQSKTYVKSLQNRMMEFHRRNKAYCGLTH